MNPASPWRTRVACRLYLIVSIFSSPLWATERIDFQFDLSSPVHAPKSDTSFQYFYDGNGNVRTISGPGGTTNYEYTPFNKLKRAVVPGQPETRYLYDANGNRVAKTNSAGTVLERYFGGIEMNAQGTTKYYFFGSQRVAKRIDNGTAYFFHQDHLGSSAVVTTNTGVPVIQRKYYEFGALESEFNQIGPEAHAYNDKRLDPETLLSDYDARSYASKSFRFLQADTEVPSPELPQSFNRYAYVMNNPLKFTDPTGHSAAPRQPDWSKVPSFVPFSISDGYVFSNPNFTPQAFVDHYSRAYEAVSNLAIDQRGTNVDGQFYSNPNYSEAAYCRSHMCFSADNRVERFMNQEKTFHATTEFVAEPAAAMNQMIFQDIAMLIPAISVTSKTWGGWKAFSLGTGGSKTQAQNIVRAVGKGTGAYSAADAANSGRQGNYVPLAMLILSGGIYPHNPERAMGAFFAKYMIGKYATKMDTKFGGGFEPAEDFGSPGFPEPNDSWMPDGLTWPMEPVPVDQFFGDVWGGDSFDDIIIGGSDY